MSKNLKQSEIKNLPWEELLWISKTERTFWSRETKRFAKIELDKRNIPKTELTELWKSIDVELESSFEKGFSIVEKQDLNQGYTRNEKLRILIGAPFSLARLHPLFDLYDLFRNKKMKKFWEKLILIILGTSLWVGIFIWSWNHSEKKRLEEIQNYELSE